VAFKRNLTGLEVVRNVCGQLGLPQPLSLIGDTGNRTAIQMVFLLNSAGQRLLKPANGYRWQVLKRTWVLPTVAGQTDYPLPADWDSFIDQTAYTSSIARAMLGPMSDQGWAFMSARLAGPTVDVVYRTRGGVFQLFTAPTESQTLYFDYTSRAWVQGSGVAGEFKDTLTDDGDVCLYESELMAANLKLRWLTEKGFDTTAAQNDFDLALELAINTDTDAPILNAAAGYGSPMLGVANLPDTGYGA
jgi:hypothetical protein